MLLKSALEDQRRTAVEHWIWSNGWYEANRGDTFIRFANGGTIDLREVLMDFDRARNEQILQRQALMEKLIMDTVNLGSRPIVFAPGTHDGQ